MAPLAPDYPYMARYVVAFIRKGFTVRDAIWYFKASFCVPTRNVL